MGLTKQAKVLSKAQQNVLLSYFETTRNPKRNKLIFLLSTRAGLRSKEIASLTWEMVVCSDGTVSDSINLENSASKGNSGGVIWMSKDLKQAFKEFSDECSIKSGRIITTRKRDEISPQVIVNMFQYWYKKLGFIGCSSHSGRRTFITNAAKKISSVGGSMRDVQMLARHSNLNMTQRYIESDVEAQKKVVDLI